MSDSTRRALRTAYQFVIALIAIVPTIAFVLPNGSPLGADIAVIIGWLTIVSKVLNDLEDRGAIPAWLKHTDKPQLEAVPDQPETPPEAPA